MPGSFVFRARRGDCREARAMPGQGIEPSLGSLRPTRTGSGEVAHEDGMKLIGLAGWSGAGKTTLLTRVIPLLIARACASRPSSTRITTSTSICRARIPSRIARPARREVLVSSGRRFALMHELRDEPECPLARSAAQDSSPVDLVIVEGFKTDRSSARSRCIARQRQAVPLSRKTSPSSPSSPMRSSTRRAARCSHSMTLRLSPL